MTDFCTCNLSHEADSLMKQQNPFGPSSKLCTETGTWLNLMSTLYNICTLHKHNHEILYTFWKVYRERNLWLWSLFYLKNTFDWLKEWAYEQTSKL